MIPLSRILSATPNKIKRRARDQCYGKAYRPPRNKLARSTLTKSGGYMVEDETGRYREFRYRMRCTDGKRKVAVRFYGSLRGTTRVWCWCSCPYFKYHCEVALASKGSSSVIQSNGQRPRFTNPRLEPRVCKHVYLLFALAMRRKVKDNTPKRRKRKRKAPSKSVIAKVKDAWAGNR